MCRCVGEVRQLAAGGGHSAVLTDACSLKELCEFRLADSVTSFNASEIEDIASRTGSDALARLCERLRYHFMFPLKLYYFSLPKYYHFGYPTGLK